MRLKMTGLAVTTAALACLGTAGVADAASSPSAAVTAATSVTDTSATVNASIKPNGDATTYYFSYGPTTSLGSSSREHTLAPTRNDVAAGVNARLSGLESGTTYYFNLTAISGAGTVTTKTIGFTTSGVTPATATTGGAAVLNANTVTFTGVVNTQKTTTEYYFQWGPTTGYGYQTSPVPIGGSSSPTTVQAKLVDIAPSANLHYRLVAVNGPDNLSEGADATVSLFPSPVPPARLSGSTTPRHATRRPYVLTTSGHVINHTSAPTADACTGTVTASYFSGRRLLHRLVMPVGPACQFTGQSTFRHLPVRGQRSARIRVTVRFNGNHYLRPRSLRQQTVTLG